MSKIGKKNILIPKESSIKIEGSNLTITGPKGTKKLTINDKIFSSKLNDSDFQLLPLQKKIDKKTSIMWGTYRSLINNAVMGVSVGHEKILELNGVGFRANLKGEILNLQIGFSHDVNFKISKIFVLNFDAGMLTVLRFLICPFLILVNISPTGSTILIFLLPT